MKSCCDRLYDSSMELIGIIIDDYKIEYDQLKEGGFQKAESYKNKIEALEKLRDLNDRKV